MATACEGCNLTELQAINRFLENDVESVSFLRSHGVLPASVTCPKCGCECTLRSDRRQWYCSTLMKVANTKKRRMCGYTTDDFKGTFLAQCQFAPWKLLLFINSWLQEGFTHELMSRNLNLSLEMTMNWWNYCCEVTEHCFEQLPAIGGPGFVMLKSGIQREYHGQYSSRYRFIRSLPDHTRLLHTFLLKVAKLYPPQSDQLPIKPRPGTIHLLPTQTSPSSSSSDSLSDVD